MHNYVYYQIMLFIYFIKYKQDNITNYDSGLIITIITMIKSGQFYQLYWDILM